MEMSKRRRWANKRTGIAVVDAASLADVPTDVPRVFVRGLPRTNALTRWVGGEHVDRYDDGHHAVVRRHTDEVGRQTITAAELWYPADVSPDVCAYAWSWTQDALSIAWHEQIALLLTPGTTGRDLWLRTPAANDCPVMSERYQTEIRAGAGQGRIETFPARSELVPGLYEYDMRVAYLAVARNLPIGDPDEVGNVPAHEVGRRHARVLARFRPASGWRHVGLLGVPTPSGMTWPTADVWHGPTWVDGAELDLALRHGWAVEIERGYVWPRSGDPLRLWAERITAILDGAVSRFGVGTDEYRAVRSMVRAIALHTIGAFHGTPHRVTRSAPSIADAPIGAPGLRRMADGSVQWAELQPAAWPEASHPEWSSHVWARTRVRLLDHPAGGGMLHVDPAALVAVRTDAVYTCRPVGWESTDDGRVGRWVLKTAIDTPAPWPRTGNDVISLRDGVSV